MLQQKIDVSKAKASFMPICINRPIYEKFSFLVPISAL
jgi:hypothetical protein